MTDFILGILFGWVPWWAWAGIALLAAGGIYKWVGWQGIAALALGVAAFFGYRQGYLDGKGNVKPVVPLEVKPTAAPKKKKRPTIFDLGRK